eukprot:m.139386 g.139386  ORF g.139386 m.139386 type:complete len:560 (-) comp16654_c0_seq1:175-1854(-)
MLRFFSRLTTRHSSPQLTPQQEVRSVSNLEFLEELGRGSFGKVVRVRIKKSGAIRALKVIEVSRVKDKEVMRMIEAEMDVLRLVGSHPHVVHFYHAWRERKMLYILLEHISDGDLFEAIRGEDGKAHGIAEVTASRYSCQIADALDYLRLQKVVMRDLKLENVLLSRVKDCVFLADFGLAKLLRADEMSRTRTICGTIQYMAPEILQHNWYSYEVDWWCLGVLLFALLVGKYPFSKGVGTLKQDRSAEDRMLMYKRISLGLIEFPDTMSAAARTVLSQLLVEQPEQRLTSLERFRASAFARLSHPQPPVTTLNGYAQTFGEEDDSFVAGNQKTLRQAIRTASADIDSDHETDTDGGHTLSALSAAASLSSKQPATTTAIAAAPTSSRVAFVDVDEEPSSSTSALLKPVVRAESDFALMLPATTAPGPRSSQFVNDVFQDIMALRLDNVGDVQATNKLNNAAGASAASNQSSGISDSDSPTTSSPAPAAAGAISNSSNSSGVAKTFSSPPSAANTSVASFMWPASASAKSVSLAEDDEAGLQLSTWDEPPLPLLVREREV